MTAPDPKLVEAVARDELPRHEQIAMMSVASLSPEERLIWLLGDMMNAVENFFGAENPKREGHIYQCAIRILDEVVAPLQASIEAATLERAAKMLEERPEDDVDESWTRREIAAAIRALKPEASK